MKRMNSMMAFILIAALLGSIFVLYSRMQVDGSDGTVQIAMDYDDLANRQDLWQIPLAMYLTELKEHGLQAVVIREKTVEDHLKQGDISVISGVKMLEMQRLGEWDLPGEIVVDPHSTYLFGDDLPLIIQIQAELVSRWGDQKVANLPLSEPWGIQVVLAYDELLAQRVGFSGADLALIAESGLDLIPVIYSSGTTPLRYSRILQSLEPYGDVRSVLFGGPSVPGYPDDISQTAGIMNDRQMVTGLIQPPDTLLGYMAMPGIDELLEQTAERGARAYIVSRSITNNVKSTDDMIDRWMNSIREYRIRILYLRPFYQAQGDEPAYQRNLTYLDQLNQEIYQAGYRTGSAPSYPQMPMQHPAMQILLMAGIAATFMLLMNLLFTISANVQLLGLAGLIGLAGLTVSVSQLAVLQWGWALAGALVFPVLAMTLLMQDRAFFRPDRYAARWGDTYYLWIKTTLITLGGAALVSALLSTNRFILDADYFRGVKVSYIAPLLAVLVIYLWGSSFSRERHASLFKELSDFFRRSIRVQDILLVGLFAGLAYLYLFRSGNTEISSVESMVRGWLGDVLTVRPRTKEFLVGHPMLILACMAALQRYRKYLIGLFAAGTIGQISVMNTFLHIRTPLMESLIRTLNGLWLGALAGIVFIVIWGIGMKQAERRKKASRGKSQRARG